MNKKFIGEIIGEEYTKWNKGDNILIKSGTGTGKTTFIKNKFKKYCSARNEKILLLTNRDTLRNQTVCSLGKLEIIDVLNYQKLENMILRCELDISQYTYIICDEANYFFTDSAFSCTTDLFFNRLIENNDVCKVFMTATPSLLIHYFKKYELRFNFTYELNTVYNYFKQVIAFKSYETIDSIIRDTPMNEQILLFSTAKRSYEIAKKYNGSFICAKGNNMYNKYVKDTKNEEELNNIIQKGIFKNRLLCTTTALDCGINIKENSDVKHIIIDIFDIDTFIQCLGRRRIGENENISLYFYAWNDKKRINGFKKKISDTINKANILIEKGEIEYICNTYKHSYGTKIIDDVISPEDGQLHKRINKCMYEKLLLDMKMYNILLGKKIPISYIDIIRGKLGLEKEEVVIMETKIKELSIEEAFERSVGVKLYKEDRDSLIKFIGLKDSRGRLQKSISQINAYLEANKFPYVIISKQVKEDNKLIRVWIIENLIIKNK